MIVVENYAKTSQLGSKSLRFTRAFKVEEK